MPDLERGGLELHESFRAAAWAARNRYDLAAALVRRDGEGDRYSVPSDRLTTR